MTVGFTNERSNPLHPPGSLRLAGGDIALGVRVGGDLEESEMAGAGGGGRADEFPVTGPQTALLVSGQCFGSVRAW